MQYLFLLNYWEAVPVYLGAGWPTPGTFSYVTLQNGAGLHILQAELAQEQLRQPGILLHRTKLVKKR
jgi:hypothetical protein